MGITIRQLEIFDKVAKYEHVTQASNQLFLTQSAVSMSISELERLAGAPLFERHGRRLILNDRGRQILPEVRDVLVKIRMIEQFLDESVGEPNGTLNVGASTTIGNYILPAIIGEFSTINPRAKALLHIGNAQQIERAVEKGDLDIGLIEGLSHISSLQTSPWRNDELVIIVGNRHEWCKKKKASHKMLENASWIMREKGSGTREIFEAAMGKSNVNYPIALELGHTEAIKKAVEAGLGVGCLSRMAVQRELDNGWLHEIDCSLNLKRTLIILTRKNNVLTTLVKSFLILLKQTEDC